MKIPEDQAEDEAEAEEEAEDEAEEEAEEEAEDEAEEEAEDEADEAEDEAENEAIKKVAEDPTVLPAELEAYGPQADLGVAFPVMIQNLSNFSGLLAAPSTDNENITHHFGHLKDIMGRTDDLRLKSQCYMLIFWTWSCNPNETTSVGPENGITHT